MSEVLQVNLLIVTMFRSYKFLISTKYLNLNIFKNYTTEPFNQMYVFLVIFFQERIVKQYFMFF